MNKLLVICGPTATGKTSLALELAEKFNGDLISADSRQIYKGLDIITGKDIPPDFKFELDHYTNGKINIWGLDLVNPDEEYSASQYADYANKAIKKIHSDNKLPIIVGGTGLYIKAVIEDLAKVSIPKNTKLRKQLEKLNKHDLFNKLKNLNNKLAENLNNSDKNNPRRLIRKIEIETYLSKHKLDANKKNKYDVLKIGLKADKNTLKENVKKRITKRLEHGATFEFEELFSLGLEKSSQSYTALGLDLIYDYLNMKINLKNLKDKWLIKDLNYAKRQITWFKKDKDIVWFDINAKNWTKKVEAEVQKWYASSKED